MKHDCSALALFSGGLDSILAARVVMDQGIPVQCIHFVSPFFGTPDAVAQWEADYGLSVTVVDISTAFVSLLRQGPEHGYGKIMNPCVDCKILMMRTARAMLDTCGAAFIVSGEVLGQRPMSQRRDTLNVIRRDAEVRDLLLRPLSAQHLDPTPMETSGLVDRSRLLGLFGRGRKEQIQLAAHYKLGVIPTPAGGCRLTERENARRFWPVLTRLPAPTAADFHLANVGRQVWSLAPGCGPQSDTPPIWLSIGRNQDDNAALLARVRAGDALFKVADMPGPIALGRLAVEWPAALLTDAAAYMASFAPRAQAEAAAGRHVVVRVTLDGETTELTVTPARITPAQWGEEDWIVVRERIRAAQCEDAGASRE